LAKKHKTQQVVIEVNDDGIGGVYARYPEDIEVYIRMPLPPMHDSAYHDIVHSAIETGKLYRGVDEDDLFIEERVDVETFDTLGAPPMFQPVSLDNIEI
jgi:hypothetical protein